MGERQASTLSIIAEAPPFRVSWDGRDIAGEYQAHRFSASLQGSSARDPKAYWILWHYWPGMPLDQQGFAIHPTIAPNGRRCTGYYPKLDDVEKAIRAILLAVDNPNVIAFRPKAHQPSHRSSRTDGPLVA